MIAAQSTAFIIGPIAKLLGTIINVLYNGLNAVGIGNIALSIVIFTVIVQILMIPLKYKSQKFTRISSMIQPQIMKIREKYKGQRDQQSMALMNQEIQEIYKNCGTSQVGGCLPMLVQMPILFALYAVIQSIPSYVDKLGMLFGQVADKIIAGNHIETLHSIKNIGSVDSLVNNKVAVMDYLYTFNISDWSTLLDKIKDIPKNTVDTILSTMNVAGDVLVSDNPWALLQQHSYIHWIWIVPILVYISAYFSIKTSQSSSTGEDNPAAKQMKTMSTIMPVISVFFSIVLPVGLGIYWIANSVLMGIQQIYMNKYIDKKGLDKIVKESIEKTKVREKKAKERKGYSANEVSRAASLNTRGIKNDDSVKQTESNLNPNSLSALANLADKYKDE